MAMAAEQARLARAVVLAMVAVMVITMTMMLLLLVMGMVRVGVGVGVMVAEEVGFAQARVLCQGVLCQTHMLS